MTQFEALLSVDWEHEYYRNSMLTSMEVYPAPETAKLLENMNIVFKKSDRGFQLYWDSVAHKSIYEIFNLFADETLIFLVSPKEQSVFFNITDEIANPIHEIVFCTPVKGSIDLDQKIMPLTSLSEILPEASLIQNIWQKSVPIMILFDSSQLQNITNSAHYRLSFNTRSSYYRYVITNPVNSNNLMVMDKHQEVQFVRTTESFMEEEQITVFTSITPLKPYQNDKKHFQLVDRTTDRPQLLIERLPLPRPGCFHKVVSNSESVVVSEVFIN